MRPIYSGTELVGQRSSYERNVFHETFNLAISRRCFGEVERGGKEMSLPHAGVAKCKMHVHSYCPANYTFCSVLFSMPSSTCLLEDGASFCYCAYVLRISRYSSFLRNLPTNTTMFLRGLWLCEKADLSKGYQNPKRKLGVTMHFSEIIELKFEKKLPHILF